MFPLGLFAIAVLFDLAAMTGAPRLVATLAHWNIVAGLLGGILAAAVAGLDIVSAPQVRVARIGVIGVLLDFWVLIIFAVVALIRLRTDDRGTNAGLLMVEMLGLAMAGLSTWFGGRLGPSRTPRFGGPWRARTGTGTPR
jgi:uncharacterized membrane protein